MTDGRSISWGLATTNEWGLQDAIGMDDKDEAMRIAQKLMGDQPQATWIRVDQKSGIVVWYDARQCKVVDGHLHAPGWHGTKKLDS